MISFVLRWVAWLLVAVIAFVTLSPIGLRPLTGAAADLERFVAFAVLGGAFCLGYPKHRWLVVLLLIAIAGSLEVLQHFVPDRHARIHDGAIKALAAAVGVVTANRLIIWYPDFFRRDPRARNRLF